MRRDIHTIGCSFGAMLLALCLATFALVGSAQAARLTIDHVDATDYGKTGTITVFFNLFDETGEVITNLDAGSIGLSIGGRPVNGRVSLQTFAASKEPMAVAFLLAGHSAYTLTFDAVDGVPTEPSTFDRVKLGVSNLITAFEGRYPTSVFRYDERGHRRVSAWTKDHRSAAKQVIKQGKCPPDECVDLTVPRFYKAVHYVIAQVGKHARENGNFPRRRVLVVVSDGAHPAQVRRDWQRRKLPALGKLAQDSGVKPFIIGFTDADREPLEGLADLAHATGGIYREVPYENLDELAARVAAIADVLNHQYVMSFKPEASFVPGSQPVRVRVTALTPDSGTAVSESAPVLLGGPSVGQSGDAKVQGCGCRSRASRDSSWPGSALLALLVPLILLRRRRG